MTAFSERPTLAPSHAGADQSGAYRVVTDEHAAAVLFDQYSQSHVGNWSLVVEDGHE